MSTFTLKETCAVAIDVYIPVNVIIVLEEFVVGVQVTEEEYELPEFVRYWHEVKLEELTLKLVENKRIACDEAGIEVNVNVRLIV